MVLPEAVKQIQGRYIAAFPIPQGTASEAFEETARQWTIRFAEQVAFELPGQGWGMKRADPNRPISKDTIARSDNGRLFIWDLLTGTGTGSPRVVEHPESEDVTGQVFVEVQPTNHLETVVPPVTPPSGDLRRATPLPGNEVAEMVAHLAAIQTTLDALLEEQRETRALLAKLTPHVP